MDKRGFLLQFSKFAIVGVIATAINLFFLYFFTEFFNVYYMLSAVFAFLIADISKYILNKKWTFNDGWGNFFRKYCNFFIVSLTALILNLALLYAFTEFFGFYYLYSQILAIAISLWVNFIGNKFWTFRGK
ncbi:MAG: GtrA family protein [Nanoarchaeota archaeon]